MPQGPDGARPPAGPTLINILAREALPPRQAPWMSGLVAIKTPRSHRGDPSPREWR